MSAEILRRAAALMRERAEGARTFSDAATGAPLPWLASPHGDVHGAAGDWMCDSASGENAEHIASWHPAVALEIAAFLAFAAAYGDQPEPQSPTVQFALSIATAYLGESS